MAPATRPSSCDTTPRHPAFELTGTLRPGGGNATLDNAQTTCGWYNASKGARDFPVNPPPGFEGGWPAELPEKDRPRRFEQLFAKQIGDDRFEICCTPFFLFDVALGDIVVTSPKGDRT